MWAAADSGASRSTPGGRASFKQRGGVYSVEDAVVSLAFQGVCEKRETYRSAGCKPHTKISLLISWRYLYIYILRDDDNAYHCSPRGVTSIEDNNATYPR